MKNQLKSYWPYVALIIVIYFAFFWRLDGALLWRDEATTACWAREMAQSNSLVPTVLNGEQLIVQGAKAHDFNHHFQPAMHGWLQFYVSALFFKIFGVNTVTARLPYSLLGIVGIVLLFLIFRKLFKKESIAVLAATACIVSLPYLHFARQSRYYGLVLVLALALIYEVVKYVEREEKVLMIPVFVRIGIYGLLLFFSNYFTFGIFWISLLFAILVFTDRKLILGFLATSVGIAVITIPVLVFVHASFIQRSEITSLPLLRDYLDWLILAFKRINQLLPIIPMLLLGLFLMIRYRKQTASLRKYVCSMWIMLIFTVLISVLLNKSLAYLRYYVYVIPISLILMAIYLNWIYMIWGRRIAGLVLVAFFIYHSWTNVLDMSEAVVKRQFLNDDSFNKPLVEFLQENVEPDETVSFIRNDKGMTACFYLPEMKWVGLLESGNPYTEIYRDRLPATMFDDYPDVDWIVVWGLIGLPARVETGYELIWNYRFDAAKQNVTTGKVFLPQQYTITQAEAGMAGSLQYYDFYRKKVE